MSDTKELNPEEKLHKLYVDIQTAKAPYVDADRAYKANPSNGNAEKLAEAVKVYEKAISDHNKHKDSDEYKDHIAGTTGKKVAGFEAVKVKDDFSNTYKTTLKVVGEKAEEKSEPAAEEKSEPAGNPGE